jgi:hypothetical protein
VIGTSTENTEGRGRYGFEHIITCMRMAFPPFQRILYLHLHLLDTFWSTVGGGNCFCLHILKTRIPLCICVHINYIKKNISTPRTKYTGNTYYGSDSLQPPLCPPYTPEIRLEALINFVSVEAYCPQPSCHLYLHREYCRQFCDTIGFFTKEGGDGCRSA